LGLEKEKTYSNETVNNSVNIKGLKKIVFPSSIFTITTDITVAGSEILLMDVFDPLLIDSFISYRISNVIYHKIARSFVSSINIKIRSINQINYNYRHPIVILLNFRKYGFT